MVKYGIQLALDKNENIVSAETCSKESGPFTCVICKKTLNFRSGTKSPKHYIHKVKSSCEGNTNEHRVQAKSMNGSIPESKTHESEIEPTEDSNDGSIPESKTHESEIEPTEDSNDGSIPESKTHESEIEPTEDSKDGSIPESKTHESEIEPTEDSKDGSIPEPKTHEYDIEPEQYLNSILEDSLDLLLEETPDPITESVDDTKDHDKEDSDVAQDVSNHVIDEALEFVVNDILKETKCTDCKKVDSGHHKMFTDEARETYGLNDLYVCSGCLSPCPACSGTNSRKRTRRTPICFTCDFKKKQWEESVEDAVTKMTPIPEAPSSLREFLKEERRVMVLRLILNKQRARTIYGFMASNKDRVPEYKIKVGEKLRINALAKALKKARKESEKTREKNQRQRERAMGPVASDRYNKMFNNKTEGCPSCGKMNKRRNMVRYTSTMGSNKFSCKGCSLNCPGCDSVCTKQDLNRFGGGCFSCLAFSHDMTDAWKKDKRVILKAALDGDNWAMATLYQKSPMVIKGKFTGDLLVHVPTGEIPSVIRRDHPELSEVANVVVTCRKM